MSTHKRTPKSSDFDVKQRIRRHRAARPTDFETPKRDRARTRLVSFEQIDAVWPSPFPDAAYLARRSRLGKFPPYIKLHSMKSPPLWRADEVAAFLHKTFGKACPELVAHAVEQLLSDD